MEIWSKCDICGRDIPVGELCYGLKRGNCICKNCCTGFENCTFTLAPMPTLTPPNEPLTLEQLREISYTDWVWAVFPELPPEENEWIRASQIYRRYPHESYGKTWIACRRPPEGEEAP